MSKLVQRAVAGGVLLLGSLVLSGPVTGQALPTPKDFVSNLDVRCYKIPDQPPLGVNLRLDHLNPYFNSIGLPFEMVTLREPQDLCVPVYKGTVPPPPSVAPFMRFVDLKCYGIDGPPLNQTVNLTHLNPLIGPLLGPTDTVVVREPQQLCVPVRKNNMNIPVAVLNLISWLDVKCYRVESATHIGGQTIPLTHLNPLFAGTPAETVKFIGPAPTQLCVPVAKNQQFPPAAVRPIIAYSDVLCYDIDGLPLNRQLQLGHLNPVLRAMGLPDENVWVADTHKLCVPVAKSTFFPPG